MARLTLSLLGRFQARLDLGPPLLLPAKAQALLAYLAARPGQTHTRDKLAALLWGGTGEAQARSNLRHTLFAIRKALQGVVPAALLAEAQTVALEPAALDVDILAFERLVADGTARALERAGGLYQGELLEGLRVDEPPFDEWLFSERERVRELAIEALGRLLAHEFKSQATERAIQTAIRLLALDALQEPIHRALMRLYARHGRRGAALRQYQVCVDLLRRELGVEPESETRQLYKEILQRREAKSMSADVQRAYRASASRRTAVAGRVDVASEETQLIGREAELARLRQAFDEAARGHGRVAMVVGEAGIGKTALLHALAAEVGRRGGRSLLGRSYESEQILPFGPWVDAFRTGLVVLDEEVLGQLSPVWRAELARLFPEVEAPGLPSPRDDPQRLFESVARLVERLAAVQPLVLLLEDLHWADEMSVRLMSFLGRRLHTWPVLMVATVREEDLPDAVALRRTVEELRRESEFLELALSPLSAEKTATLVRSLARVGTDPGALASLEARVWRVSEGNPFMVVETLRAGAETRAIGSAALSLPERVREIVAGRLERLSDHGRELAEVAAVIGRDFDFALLQRSSRLTERDAASAVEELVRRRVLHGVGEGFDFTHDRIREVVYDRLLAPRRKLLHGEIASAIEALHAGHLEPHYAALGSHCREGEVWEKAVTFLQLSAAQAFARSALRDAATSYEDALSALARLPETRERLEQAVDIRTSLRTSLVPLGEFTRAFAHLREAELLAERLGDLRRLGWLSSAMTNVWAVVGDPDRALAASERALALAASLGDQKLEAVANQYLGQVYFVRGECSRARAFCEQAAQFFSGDHVRERCDQIVFPAVFCRARLAWCLAEIGLFIEAIARGEEAVRIAESLDQPVSLMVASHLLGQTHLCRGDLQTAISTLERGLGFCRSFDIPYWIPLIAAPLGRAYALSGRLAEAVPLLEQAAEERATSLLGLASQSLRIAWLGEAYLSVGRARDAGALADRALAMARLHKERGNEAWVRRFLADVAGHKSRSARALAGDGYRQALGLAEQLGMRPLVAHCHLSLGKLYRRTGNQQQAQGHLSVAATMYREMDMTYWLNQAETVGA